jgi:UDP-N-acetyl-2-amino-2-deoxyglucuronate dehydrogenase
MARTGIGLIGTGMVAATHARALADLADRVEVRGVWSRGAERRRAFAAKTGLPERETLQALLDDARLDAVIVLTPPDARAEIVAACARAGKHVLLEKPIERGTAAAEAIVATCEHAGVTLGVVFQHRFRAASIKLKQLVESRAFGSMAAVQVAVPWWRPQSYYDEPGRGSYARDGGGVLITQAIHTLDLMLSLTGQAAQVQAIAGTTRIHEMESEDFVGGGLVFENGALGALVATTAHYPGRPETIAIDFETASVLLGGGVLAVEHHDGRRETFGQAATTGGGADPMAFTHEWHRDAIADFLDAIENGRPPAVPGRAALEVHRLIDALLLSARERRAVEVANVGS